jgi:hypothetical protein
MAIVPRPSPIASTACCNRSKVCPVSTTVKRAAGACANSAPSGIASTASAATTPTMASEGLRSMEWTGWTMRARLSRKGLTPR